MAVKLTATDRLLKLAWRQPILRVKDLLAAGIRLERLRRLHQRASRTTQSTKKAKAPARANPAGACRGLGCYS